MVYIAPSLLAADFSRLAEEIERIERADMLHVDVMDGHFVPNLSIGPPVIEALRKKTKLPFDVHLMMEEPLAYTSVFRQAGADIITFHVECKDPPQAVLSAIKASGAKAGVAISPKTPVEAIGPWGEDLSQITVMTVEPGFGGQKFMADMMPKLFQLRRWIDEGGLDCELEVDGGVDPATCHTVIENGANVLVAGSAVYKAADIPARIKELRG